MSDPLFWHRLQFGFTAAFHYLFPQLPADEWPDNVELLYYAFHIMVGLGTLLLALAALAALSMLLGRLERSRAVL